MVRKTATGSFRRFFFLFFFSRLFSLAKSFYDYIDNVVTFTVLAKVNTMKCFYNTKVSGLGKIFLR